MKTSLLVIATTLALSSAAFAQETPSITQGLDQLYQANQALDANDTKASAYFKGYPENCAQADLTLYPDAPADAVICNIAKPDSGYKYVIRIDTGKYQFFLDEALADGYSIETSGATGYGLETATLEFREVSGEKTSTSFVLESTNDLGNYVDVAGSVSVIGASADILNVNTNAKIDAEALIEGSIDGKIAAKIKPVSEVANQAKTEAAGAQTTGDQALREFGSLSSEVASLSGQVSGISGSVTALEEATSENAATASKALADVGKAQTSADGANAGIATVNKEVNTLKQTVESNQSATDQALADVNQQLGQVEQPDLSGILAQLTSLQATLDSRPDCNEHQYNVKRNGVEICEDKYLAKGAIGRNRGDNAGYNLDRVVEDKNKFIRVYFKNPITVPYIITTGIVGSVKYPSTRACQVVNQGSTSFLLAYGTYPGGLTTSTFTCNIVVRKQY